jgi:hypothetical protein
VNALCAYNKRQPTEIYCGAPAYLTAIAPLQSIAVLCDAIFEDQPRIGTVGRSRLRAKDCLAVFDAPDDHTFGGWKRSGFRDLNQGGPDSISFYTKTRTVTQGAVGPQGER